MSELPVLQVDDLSRRYTLPRESLFKPPGSVYALNGVSFEIKKGRSFGVVGESGCGKSTLARLVMALEPPTGGDIRILGHNVNGVGANDLRQMRQHFQMVFQDPFGSLDPRKTVAWIVSEPLAALDESGNRDERKARVAEVLEAVGLRKADMDKYPHEFSGGQRQRIAIARALVTRPALIVADEPVSALDVSVQAQVLNLLKDLQDEFQVTYMLISHDLGVVEYVCDEVAVMYLGKIVEQAPTADIFANPQHPYTKALLEAAPRIGAGRRRHRAGLKGTVMNQTDSVKGCVFAARCPLAETRCKEIMPDDKVVVKGHRVACHLV
jgi:peptide/nickel transport system ATP-binding protein